MLVVADSSALVALATCGALQVLASVYDEIKVPRAVYDEVIVADKPLAAVLASFLTEKVISVDMARWVLAAGGLGARGVGSNGAVQAAFGRCFAD